MKAAIASMATGSGCGAFKAERHKARRPPDLVLERYQAGKVEGEATMFKAMLASRFGPLPGWANHQIAGATSVQLLAWGEQLFTASSLEQLLQQA